MKREELEKKSIHDLIEELSDSKRLQKANTIKNTDIRIVFQSEEGYMYEIKGTKQSYFLKIDTKNKTLVHNCEDWLHRGMRDYRLCKHFIRIFQLLFEKDAKKILIDLILQPWAVSDSDDYLKRVV